MRIRSQSRAALLLTVAVVLGVVGGLGSLGNGAGVGLVSLGLYGLTVYALFARADVFQRAGGR